MAIYLAVYVYRNIIYCTTANLNSDRLKIKEDIYSLQNQIQSVADKIDFLREDIKREIVMLKSYINQIMLTLIFWQIIIAIVLVIVMEALIPSVKAH